ncbi:hypothetical protein Dimus_016190 [Dionaea muscipula]
MPERRLRILVAGGGIGRQVFAMPERRLRILVAGGGIGRLVFALTAKRKGFDVVVFERDMWLDFLFEKITLEKFEPNAFFVFYFGKTVFEIVTKRIFYFYKIQNRK